MRERVKRRWERKAKRMKRRGERIRRQWQRRGQKMKRRWKRRGEEIRRRALEEAYRDLAKERAHRPDSDRAGELERALREANRRHQDEIQRILEKYGDR